MKIEVGESRPRVDGECSSVVGLDGTSSSQVQETLENG